MGPRTNPLATAFLFVIITITPIFVNPICPKRVVFLPFRINIGKHLGGAVLVPNRQTVFAKEYRSLHISSASAPETPFFFSQKRERRWVV